MGNKQLYNNDGLTCGIFKITIGILLVAAGLWHTTKSSGVTACSTSFVVNHVNTVADILQKHRTQQL